MRIARRTPGTAPRSSATGQDRPARIAGRTRAILPAVPVVALALIALTLAGRGAYQATARAAVMLIGSDVEVEVDRAEARRQVIAFDGVRGQLRRQVPAGRTIVLDRTMPVLWQQRIAEFATMCGIHVVTRARDAQYRVGLAGGTGSDIPVLAITRIG